MNADNTSVYSYNCHQKAKKFDVFEVNKVMHIVYKEL